MKHIALQTHNTHIVIACSYLHVPGGYEKAIITTANLFAEKGHRVTLLILDHTADTYYPVHPSVTIVHRHLNFGITDQGNPFSRKWRMWMDIRKLRALLKELQPDHLICSEYPFTAGAILARAKRYCKVYSWEHHHYAAQQPNRFWKSLMRKTYRQLDAVVCLNKDEQQYYLSLNEKATVIPNFIAAPSGGINDRKEFDLISVTRFNHIKGIDLLMAVAKIILPANPQLKWKVIGYGEQKDELLDFIEKENLSGQLVYQPADKTNLTEDYRSAAVFIMTSRNECFPLVLLEAMSNGLPCIAFDCETGPRHIIRQNETGFLVNKEDVKEMAEVILQLINDKSSQQRMSEEALKSVQSFYPDKVYDIWAALFGNNNRS